MVIILRNILLPYFLTVIIRSKAAVYIMDELPWAILALNDLAFAVIAWRPAARVIAHLIWIDLIVVIACVVWVYASRTHIAISSSSCRVVVIKVVLF